jgi:GNAT superfamily N-acetyltransferase
MRVSLAKTEAEVSDCYDLIRELRPHLTLNDFIIKVSRMANTTGYELAYLHDGGIKAVAGFRVSEWLHSGTYLEIEELITDGNSRSKGYGSTLFDWLHDYASQQGCCQIRLVSGVLRESAHRFYAKKGMVFEAKYFSLNIEQAKDMASKKADDR